MTHFLNTHGETQWIRLAELGGDLAVRLWNQQHDTAIA